MRRRPRSWLAWGVLVAAIASPPALAKDGVPDAFEAALELDLLAGTAVSYDGRLRSFDSHARLVMNFISGPHLIDGQDPVFTLMDLAFRPERYVDRAIIHVSNKPMRAEIARALRASSAAEGVPDLEARLDRFLDTGLLAPTLVIDPEVTRLLARLRTDLRRTAPFVGTIMTAMRVADPTSLRRSLALLPPASGVPSAPWRTLDELAVAVERGVVPEALPSDTATRLVAAWDGLAVGWRAADADAVNAAAAELATMLPAVHPGLYPTASKLGWERWYVGHGHLTWGWIVYLGSVVLLLMSVTWHWPAARRLGLAVFVSAFAIQTFALGLRFYVAGRWPNTTMFESLTTAAWFGACFALLMEALLRRTPMRNLFALASAVASMAAMMAVRAYPMQLSPHITNKMPVLHDIWIYIHTNVIIFSYCLIFLAAVSAVMYLARRVFMRWRGTPGIGEFARHRGAGSLIMRTKEGDDWSSHPATTFGQVLDGTTMILVELAFILLWTGLVMGAIWADHSWGRPWGWDPKEVFALNTFIVFIILIHTRMKVRDKGLWTALIAVAGCAVMLFNWIIINFTIAGLHSYA